MLPDALRRGGPAADRSSIEAFEASQRRAKHGAFPESEIRETIAVLPDGRLGEYKASTREINLAVGRGQIKRDYSNIRVPVLAFIDYPWPPDDPPGSSTLFVNDMEYQPANDDERAAIIAYVRVNRRRVDARSANLKRSVANAEVIDLPRAGHHVFLTREAEVLSGMHRFMRTVR